MSDPQQRAHPRYAIELDAQLFPVGGGAPIAGRTHDISRGGFCLMCLDLATLIPNGTVCEVRLSLVFSETEFSEPLVLTGSVMWCTRLKHATQVGVKFEGLDARMSGFLDLFIGFLEGGEEDTEKT
ncbi:MAG: PilZ domain-containing protein [Polyangia bacterium]